MKPSDNDMHPHLYDAFLFWRQKMDLAAIPFKLTCVLRTQGEQNALYAQGRLPIDEVNALRKVVGMSELIAKENLRKVTWTKKSKHFPDLLGYSKAFDFCIMKPDSKEITWDIKWDGNLDAFPDYLQAAQFAKEVGLEAGAFWDTPDYPHIQLRANV